MYLFTAALGLRCCTLTSASGASFLFWLTGFSLAVSAGSRCARLQCSSSAGGSVAEAHMLQGSGSVAVVQLLSSSITCGIFLDRDQTCFPCVGRWILCQLHHQGSLK